MQKIVFILTYDSYVRSLLPIIEFFQGKQIACDFYLYDLGMADAQIAQSKSQFGARLPSYNVISDITALFKTPDIKGADAIFFAFGGRPLGRALEAFYKLHNGREQKPMSVTLSPGIRTPQDYSGFAARTLSDLILLNGEADLEEYNDICTQAGVNLDNAMVFGLPALALHKAYKRTASRDIKSIYFVDQSTVPRGEKNKTRLAENLLEYAKTYPDRTLTILMKNRAGSCTAHESDYGLVHAFENIGARYGIARPDNLLIADDAVETLFEKADLCLSISSTVLLECLYLNIPAAAINDFGFHRKLGNGHFEHSGISLSMNQLLLGEVPSVDSSWAARHIVSCDGYLVSLLATINAHKMADEHILRDRRRARAHFRKLKLRTYKWPKRLYKYMKVMVFGH